MSFSNLHLHTSNGSFLDSMVKIPDLMERLKELGHTACACTDHGSLSALINFHDACVKNGIKPILGCEFYEAAGSRFDDNNTYHLILLAKNYSGYLNLINLSTQANLTAKYKHAGRIDFELLEKYNEGLICMSACLSGRVAKTALSDKENIYNVIKLYHDIFGDDYYLEIMDNGIDDQYTVNDVVIEAGKRLNIPVIMTNDTHYLNDGDEDTHDIIKRIHYNKKEPSGFFGFGYHLRSADEFDKRYRDYLDTDCVTDKIEIFDIKPKKGTYYMPLVANSSELMINECKYELERYLHSSILEYRWNDYKERLDYELSVINNLGYADYFMIVSDFVKWSRKNGVLIGVGRGSVGGSLVSFLLKIIGVDPLNEECPLYFERFLNPDRVSMPDIDIDVSDRDKIISYLKDKYGESRVVRMGTVATLGTRDAMRSVARVMGYSDRVIKPILQAIPTIAGDYTNESLYNDDENYRKIIDDNTLFKEIFNHAVKIEGCYKNFSQHASGVVIAPCDLNNVPLNFANDNVFTQYDMHNIEDLGYVKFDILGLRTLTIIEKTLNKIGDKIDLLKIDYLNPDKNVMKFIRDGNTNCVFQFESDGYKALIKRVKPERFSELVDLSTLYRPGPVESGLTDMYINRKFGVEPVEYIHESTKNVLKRYGLPLFQEELMLMCSTVAGFTLAQADTVRKAIGKKDKELLDAQKELFVNGCIKTSELTYEKSIELWEMIEKFGRYSFNISHGFAYTVMSYWTAWLSYYYPAEFLSSNIDMAKNFDETVKIINEAKLRGITVVPPSINKSNYDTTVENNDIYMSFNVIKNLSSKITESILENRSTPFLSFEDFENRVNKRQCNKLAKLALVESGCFDEFLNDKLSRYSLIEQLKYDITDYSMYDLLKREYSRIGFYINQTPIDLFKLHIYNPMCIVSEIVSVKKWKTKNNKNMCFLQVSNYDELIDITVFPEQYECNVDTLKQSNILAFFVNVSEYGYHAAMIVPLITDGNNVILDNFLPVVSHYNNFLNDFNFDRFSCREYDNGKIEISYCHGNSNIFSYNDIIGWRLKCI